MIKRIKKLILPILLSMGLIMTIINIISCVKSTSCDGTECCTCSKDSDCQSGLTCEFFSGKYAAFNACALPSTNTCSK